jgi:hypothetical protein
LYLVNAVFFDNQLLRKTGGDGMRIGLGLNAAQKAWVLAVPVVRAHQSRPSLAVLKLESPTDEGY